MCSLAKLFLQIALIEIPNIFLNLTAIKIAFIRHKLIAFIALLYSCIEITRQSTKNALLWPPEVLLLIIATICCNMFFVT